ncbi:MAG TPA: hypothetical protein VGJ12_10265, partial [Gemmatimonadaceae bacterium]
MPDDVGVTRTKRAAHGDLAGARRCAQEEEVANVQTGDQQEQYHGTGEEREHWSGVAKFSICERLGDCASQMHFGL